MAQAARSTLRDLGIANVEIRAGDISAQHFNTFDAIIIEGAVDEVPDALIRLLAPDGRLVCIVRQGPTGIASLSTRTSTGVVTRSSFNATLPLLEQAAAPEVFVF